MRRASPTDSQDDPSDSSPLASSTSVANIPATRHPITFHRCRVLSLSRWGRTRSRAKKIISKHGRMMTWNPIVRVLRLNQHFNELVQCGTPEQPRLSSREMQRTAVDGYSPPVVA